MRTIENLVQTDVHYCVSTLVAALANMSDVYEGGDYAYDLHSILVQDDYEEPCIQAGWTVSPDRDGGYTAEQTTAQGRGRLLLSADTVIEAWRDLAESEQIEPMQREALEHWIVSEWLADKLEEQGEMVARDLYGMTVWGRCTSGQAIDSDSVMERIHAGTCHISRRFL